MFLSLTIIQKRSCDLTAFTSFCGQNNTLENIVIGINICVLEQSHRMGRDVEQSQDSLCLSPAQLIRV